MSSIGDRIKEERERLGLTLVVFAELADSKKNTVIDWQKDVSSPPLAKLSALEKLGFDVSYVITGKRLELPDSIPADEQLLLEGYRALPIDQRRAMLSAVITRDFGGAKKNVAKSKKGNVNQGSGVQVNSDSHDMQITGDNNLQIKGSKVK